MVRVFGSHPGGPVSIPGTNFWQKLKMEKKLYGSGGIRTHASEETGALNQRLRPLGHATVLQTIGRIEYVYVIISNNSLSTALFCFLANTLID